MMLKNNMLNYIIISSSADCGLYDVELDENIAQIIGLDRKSVIKTTKIYTGPRSKFGKKIGDLPENKKSEFIEKYKNYQLELVNKLQS